MEHVTLKEIAPRLQMDRSRARRWILQNGFEFVRVRDIESKQTAIALTIEDAERAIELRSQKGFISTDSQGNQVIPIDSAGVFYAICLMPDIAPNRIKFGFASSLQARIDAHRTTCPHLELIKKWPCKSVYEPAAIAIAANGSAKLYGNEVYDVESIHETIDRLDKFFAMLG